MSTNEFSNYVSVYHDEEPLYKAKLKVSWEYVTEYVPYGRFRFIEYKKITVSFHKVKKDGTLGAALRRSSFTSRDHESVYDCVMENFEIYASEKRFDIINYEQALDRIQELWDW